MHSFLLYLSFSSLVLAKTCNAGRTRTSSSPPGPASTSSSTAAFKVSPGATFVYAINDPNVPANAVNAQVYDIDLFDTSAATIAGYKSQGKKVVS